MSKRLIIPVILGVALMAIALPASARVLDSYCSPSGDYCTGVFREGDRVKLRISTFSFRGTYTLCVRGPGGGRECDRFALVRKPRGIFASRVDFARRFEHAARGRYAVSWHYGGQRLGPALHFASL